MKVEIYSVDPYQESRGSRRQVWDWRPQFSASATVAGDPAVQILGKDEEAFGTGERGGEVRVSSKSASVWLYGDELVELLKTVSELDLPKVPRKVALQLAKQLINQAVS